MSGTKELLKKVFLIGVGATVVTAEKVKEVVDELVEKGELSQTEGKSFAEDLKARAVKEKESFEAKVKETVEQYTHKAIESLGLVKRDEFEALKAEFEACKASKES
jgi:polyhydroxyalkanoate synthesis regulator phasin